MTGEFAAGAFVAFIVSVAACSVLLRTGPIDRPNQAHKRHRDPTPTSGGLGIGLGFALGLLTNAQISDEWRVVIEIIGPRLLAPAALFALCFLFLGFIDDNRAMGPRLKSLVFGTLSVAAAASVGLVEILPLGFGVSLELPYFIGLIGTAMWVFTMVNCVNFMDGSNGLAIGSVAIGLIALAVIAQANGTLSGVAIGLCGAGAMAGFLMWNFPHAKLFAGDAGALFAGAVAALGSLIVIERAGISPFIPPLIFLPLLADALLTLAWRLRRGRSLLDGHSEHLYQIASRARWSHARIAYTYWAATALCGIVAIAVAGDAKSIWPLSALMVASVASMLIAHFVRRYALAKGIAEV